MSKNENKPNEATDLNSSIGNTASEDTKKAHLKERRRIKPTPIAAVKPTIADNIKRLHKQGFDENRIAAMLMCHKSLIREVLK